ncbi:hypothetical protein HYW20_05420 [Candidatus Woesearchaeota archaeon]|nr:hypothetical protein [Candidatus Woesearchaeota archaeon]
MKKKILFGLMLVMGFVLGLINVQAVLVPPCGPSLPPPWCQTAINCGAKECTAVYEAIDAPASALCHTDYDVLCPIPEPDGFCSPYNPFWVCQGTTAKGASCDTATCTLICQTGAAYVYKGIEATAESTATAFYTSLKAAGFFGDIVPCGEIDSCMEEVPVSALQSYNRLTCEGIKQSTLVRIFGDPAVNKALLEQVLPEIATRPEVLDALKSTGYQFVSPEQLAKFINDCGFECGTNTLEAVVNQQKLSVLANKAVDAARAAYGIELSTANEMGVTALKLYNNLYQKFEPLINLYNHPLVRLASVAHGAYSIVSSAFSGSGGGSEQAASVASNTLAAKNDIITAANCNIDGSSRITKCEPREFKGGNLKEWVNNCLGQPNCVLDDKDGALQCIAALPGGKDKPVEVRLCSIHVIDHRLNNMFTLTGKQNQGVVYQTDGFVNIDKGGTTKISVAGTGAFITDVKNNQLYIGPGTTFYYGKGDSEEDTYVTNAMILDYDSRIGVADVNAVEQQRYPENKQKNLKQNIELAVTFNKRDLQGYKNAINIEKSDGSYEITARGFSDILLLEEEKVFPLVTRNYAKGDASIIMHRNVKIPNTYIVNDETYEYTIKTIDDSTKVITKNGKIIEDSGSFDTRLSRRQNILVNNI